jgi:transposase
MHVIEGLKSLFRAVWPGSAPSQEGTPFSPTIAPPSRQSSPTVSSPMLSPVPAATVAGAVALPVESRAAQTARPTAPPVSAPGGRRFFDQPVIDRSQFPGGRKLPGPKPPEIVLTDAERGTLEHWLRARSYTAESAQRARIILYYADTPCVSRVAKKLDLAESTVRLWRNRFLAERLDGLYSRPIPGRPPRIDALTRCMLIAMACGKPEDFSDCFRNTWTVDSLHDTFIVQYPDIEPISRSSVERILEKVDLKPHRLRPWLHSPDRCFRIKVNDICALYQKAPDGSIVLCIDEKTGMQALGRKHPTKPAVPGKAGRHEFEYIRHGTRSLLAAFNPHTGEVFAQVKATRTADDLVAFMEQLAIAYPDVQIHVVWDNLNIHHEGKDQRWTAFNARHNGRFHFHYTPIHASWVNQVELFFGILSKRVLRYGVFDSAEALERAVSGFIAYWNRFERHPFAWKFKGYPLVTGQAA